MKFNLEIIIRYKPQDWFEIGLMISLTTFIGCITYLFYDWRREKGDKWAKKLESKVRKLIGKGKHKPIRYLSLNAVKHNILTLTKVQ